MIKETTSPAVSKPTFCGTWHNQHDSEMTLMSGPDGSLVGSFRLQEKHESKSFPLVGFVSGDVIAFCVNFAPRASVTSWVGHIIRHPEVPDEVALETMWNMAIQVGDEPTDCIAWKSNLSGFDVFHHGPRTGSMLWHRSAAIQADDVYV